MRNRVVSLIVFLLTIPLASSLSISDYTGWPISFPGDGCQMASPGLGELNANTSDGQELFVSIYEGGHGCASVQFYLFLEDGSPKSGSSISGTTLSTPAAGDIDGYTSNGLEIVFSVGSDLYAYHNNGTRFWGPVSLMGTGYTPAISDVDNDGSLEIAIGVDNSITLLDSYGVLLWNKSTVGKVEKAPAFGDLDVDGYLEIIVTTSSGMIYVFDKDGSILSGWPQTAGTGIKSAPTLGDVDNDGDLEVVAAVTGPKILVYENDGTRILEQTISSSSSEIKSTPALGDLDGDGDLEIVFGDAGDSKVHALHHEGSYLSGWPVSFSVIGTIRTTPALADLDGDSDIEVVIQLSFEPSRLFILEHDGTITYSKTLAGGSESISPAIGKNSKGKSQIGIVTYQKVYLLNSSDSYDIKYSPWPMHHRDVANTGMLSPVGKIISPSSGSYNKGSTISFSGSGLSIDGDLSYSWKSNGTEIGDTASFTKSDLEPGTHIIKLTVTDPKGRIDESAPVTLNVINLPSTLNITSPNEGQLFETGENITFSGVATDPDGTVSSITWKANNTVIYTNDSVNQQSINISFDYDQLTSGSYIISFSATDSDGAVSTDKANIRINSPPSADIIKPLDSSSHRRGSPVVFVGSGSDSDGTIVSYRWTGDGEYLSNSKSFGTSFSAVGLKTITLEVTDDDGAVASTSIDIVIKSPPVSTTIDFVPPITEAVPPIFAKKGFLSEKEVSDMIEDLGHMYGKKYAFDVPASPLASPYASKGEVVIGKKQMDKIWSPLPGFEANLYQISDIDIYSAAAFYALEHYTDFTNLIIVRGDLNVDSLAAAPLAKLLEAPILLVRPNEIPNEDLVVLDKMNGKGRIYIIGGVEAISLEVEEELKKYTGAVVRIGGSTRYETSIEIARQMSLLIDTESAVSVNGRDPDLYAATLGAKYNAPVIYLDTPFSTLDTSLEDLDIHQKAVVEFISEKFDTVGELYYRPT